MFNTSDPHMARYNINQICIFFILLCFLSFSSKFCTEASSSQSENIHIGFHFFKPGQIYEEAYQGIIDGLELEGIAFESIIYRSGRNKDLASSNLIDLDKLNLDIIISFSSAGTRIASVLALQTPLLSSVINHPISLGIEKEKSTVRPNLSGTSYYIDANSQLDLYLELFPQATKIGMLYDSNNPAGYLAEEPMMRKACRTKNLEFHAVGATGRDDLELAAQTLLKKNVQMIIIPTNLQIYNNLDLVLRNTNPLKVPVVSMNKQGVEKGALAALFADTYKTGRQMVWIIKEIVENRTHPSEIPFLYPNTHDLIINLKSAAALDYEFNPDTLGRASIVLN